MSESAKFIARIRYHPCNSQLDRTGRLGELRRLGKDAADLLTIIRDDFQSDVSVPKAQIVAGTARAVTVVRRALAGMPGKPVAVAANLGVDTRMGAVRA